MVNRSFFGATALCRSGAAALVVVLAGCVSSQGDTLAAITPPASLPTSLPADPDAVAVPAQQPRYAAYLCEGGGALTVENFQTSALVVGPNRESAELPASPSGQTRRYAAAPYVLELDGTRATFSREGRKPLFCARTEP